MADCFRMIVLLGAALVFFTAEASAGVLPDCGLSAPETGKVAEIIDGETLKLADGRTVRLVGAKTPRLLPAKDEKMQPYAQKTVDALTALTKGKAVALRFGGQRTDRHGYLMAQVFSVDDDSPVWIQGALVERGLARVYSLADNAACTEELLALEVEARAGQLGIWMSDRYRVQRSDDLDGLNQLAGTYQLVEGRVLEVAEVQSWIFLNFEEDWREDFTVAVERKDAKGFDRSGLDLAGLAGKPIRVRGWLERRYGPSIKATHPQQIEVMEDGSGTSAGLSNP